MDERLDDRLGTGRRVRRWARLRRRGQLVAASALTAANQAGEALVPVLVGVVIDRAVRTGDGVALAGWSAVLVVVYAGLSLSHRFGQRRTHYAAVLVEQELRLRVLRRVTDPRGGADRDRTTGELISIATIDVWRVAIVNYLVPLVVAAGVGVLVGGVALFAMSPLLGAVVLLGAPPLLLAVHLLGIPLRRRGAAQQERAAAATAVAVDLVAGLRVLKGLGAEGPAGDRYRVVSGRSRAAATSVARAGAAHQGAVVVLNGLFLVVVAAVGLAQAAAGVITVGQLVAAIGLAQFVQGPITVFATFTAFAAAGRASADRVAAVLAEPPAVSAGDRHTPAPSGAGRLVLDDLHAAPLCAVSVAIDAGEHVGIAAADPADSLALVRCLSRERDPSGGRIVLDGIDVTTLPPQTCRGDLLATVHDIALFPDTVTGVIGSLGAGEDAVSSARKAAGVEEMLRSFPLGGATPVTERGRSLSGGQRQRVALARALAAEPPVLVLHEPTTAVDAVTENRIAAAVRALRAGRTTVLVTTAPALLAATDRVVVLRDGRVAATGSHRHLLATDPGYVGLVTG